MGAAFAITRELCHSSERIWTEERWRCRGIKKRGHNALVLQSSFNFYLPALARSGFTHALALDGAVVAARLLILSQGAIGTAHGAACPCGRRRVGFRAAGRAVRIAFDRTAVAARLLVHLPGRALGIGSGDTGDQGCGRQKSGHGLHVCFLLGCSRILRHPGMLSLIDFKTTTPSVFRLYRSQVSFPGHTDLIAPKRAPRLTRNRFTARPISAWRASSFWEPSP